MRTSAYVALLVSICVGAGPDSGLAQVRTLERPAFTSTEDLNDVRPFLAWVQDAAITEGIDFEPVFEFSNHDFGTGLFAGARVAYWVAEGVEVGGRFGVNRQDFDGDLGSSSGASDLLLHGRYQLDTPEDWPQIAVGTSLDVPIGDSGSGGNTFDVTAFAAGRYELVNGVDVIANAGVESLDRGDRENGLRLGGGAIIPITDDLAAVAEFNIGTAGEFAAITGGVDLELPPGGHLRGGISLGLDSGAPDYVLLFGLSIPVY